MTRVVHLGPLLVALALSLASCGDVPSFRWSSGSPTSFAFAREGATPSGASVIAGNFSARAVTGHFDYGDQPVVRIDPGEIESTRSSNGTKVATYTPDVFRLPMIKVGFLCSETGDGFWVIQSNEGIFAPTEFVDFLEPVYITGNTYWEPLDYDTLFAGFELGISDTGGVPFEADIQVVAPGYTDEEMPDYWLTGGGWQGSDTVRGYMRRYMGNNRFAVTADELFATADETRGLAGIPDPPQMLMFRDSISTPALFNALEERQDSIQEVFVGGNQWALSVPFGPSYPKVWADMPFAGLTIGDDTTAIVVTVSWDLDNIVELWDFGENGGLRFQLASDFIERFTVTTELISG